MIISPYLYPYCSVLAASFGTKFGCSYRRVAIRYTHDIFHNICKRPHHATGKISNLYIENKYHHLTLENKFRLLWTRVYNSNFTVQLQFPVMWQRKIIPWMYCPLSMRQWFRIRFIVRLGHFVSPLPTKTINSSVFFFGVRVILVQRVALCN